jgi:hypothetical protein
MASVAYVTSNQVLQANEQQFIGCPITVQLNCANIQPQGVAWFVPVTSNGLLYSYNIVIDSAKPTADSVHAIRLWDKEKNVTYWAAIDDSDTEATFVTKCNACCGATPVMATVTIPAPLVQDCPCIDDSGKYNYFIPVPSNPNTLDYLISGIFNGVAGTPAPAGGGYANTGTLLTFLNTATTGWAAYGVWSYVNSNKTLKLVSTTVICAQIELSLETKSYCFQIPSTATEVNGITIGATPVTTDFPNIFFDDTSASNRQAIIDAIRPFLIGELTLETDSGDYFVKYTGIQLPVHLTLDGSTVSGTTFATGTCP